MGGIGKTELALQYAIAHLSNYPGGICWLRAQEPDIGTQIVNFARSQLTLSPPDGLDLSSQAAYGWRNWPSGNVLVVLDDVTEYGAIAPYLPPIEPRFKVLITTRLHFGKSVQPFKIEVLEPDAALDLLSLLAGADRVQGQVDEATALCHWLGNLPLGLELVGRYLARKPDLTLAQMQQRLEAKRLEARALDQTEPGMTAPLGIAAAIELSWQDLNNTAQHLGSILSLFALAPISWPLVERCWADLDEEILEDARDEGLLKVHLLQRVGEQTYQLHQLVREFFRAKLEELAEASDLKQRVCLAIVEVAQQIPNSPTQELILQLTPSISHIEEVAENLTNWLSDDDLITPAIRIGCFYQGQGFYTQAEPWYQKALSLAQAHFGESHLHTATSKTWLASLLQDQGHYKEAKTLFIQTLRNYRKILGRNHQTFAQALNNVAAIYYQLKRYHRSEYLHRITLHLREKLLGKKHIDVAQSLNNLALVCKAQERYAEAEKFYKRSLELTKCLIGKDHPGFATALNNLAGIYTALKRFSEAEPLLKQALELRKRALREDHPDIATSLNNLGENYHHQRHYSKAETCYQEALEIAEPQLGSTHPTTIIIWENLEDVQPQLRVKKRSRKKRKDDWRSLNKKS